MIAWWIFLAVPVLGVLLAVVIDICLTMWENAE